MSIYLAFFFTPNILQRWFKFNEKDVFSILSWYDIVVGLKEHETDAGETLLPYTELLEKSIPAGVFSFKDSPAVRSEIHESLGKLCGSITSLYRKVCNLYYFYSQEFKANVHGSPLRALTKWFSSTVVFESTINYQLKNILQEWKKNFENLEEESRKLLDDMKKELERKEQVIEDLSNVNEELKSYIDFVEKSNGCAYKGKSISDVKKKSRTLNCFLQSHLD